MCSSCGAVFTRFCVCLCVNVRCTHSTIMMCLLVAVERKRDHLSTWKTSKIFQNVRNYTLHIAHGTMTTTTTLRRVSCAHFQFSLIWRRCISDGRARTIVLGTVNFSHVPIYMDRVQFLTCIYRLHVAQERTSVLNLIFLHRNAVQMIIIWLKLCILFGVGRRDGNSQFHTSLYVCVRVSAM